MFLSLFNKNIHTHTIHKVQNTILYSPLYIPNSSVDLKTLPNKSGDIIPLNQT